jgi:hypothetical protein
VEATPVCSLLSPSAIFDQNARSTSRRIGGRPGERIAGLPVCVTNHPAGRPATHLLIEVLRPHLLIEVLRRPVESALHTGVDLLTDKQRDRLAVLFATDDLVEVEATWGIYQRMIAYREPDRARGRELMSRLIALVSAGVPAALVEIVTLGRTLKKRAVDVLAYFYRPVTSNGPTEAFNGRLEHLRGSALGSVT